MGNDQTTLYTSFVLSVTQCRKIATLVGQCMSKEEARYYLKGVLFENAPVNDDGHLAFKAVATDGYTCAVLNIIAIAEGTIAPEVEFSRIFPPKAIEMLAKLDKKKADATFIQFALDGMKLSIKHLDTGLSTEFLCIDGTFPDYRRVIPAKAAPTIAFNAEYIGRIATAMKAAGHRNTVVTLCLDNPSGPFHVEVKGEDDLTLIVMPSNA